MEGKTAINIGLHFNEQVIDLRIPNRVTLEQLVPLLQEALTIMNVTLPESFSLELINKPIRINPQLPLANYPISDGDQLFVRTEKENNGTK
ncbi:MULTISPECIES: EsaB/YukD family protein [Enterococcus]|uniref:EsaB/YukD family protein n=1 Tax=Candidatus Enterococcus murrayae TaxID=2815321 RepID=A0ABS3HBY2_9ENTE|nr:EsaB/YukD family protein [Enterococcus sp. MJM16]MBO0450966.1 EsaB/YukD family protein [Enterococcus sp. MJM16]